MSDGWSVAVKRKAERDAAIAERDKALAQVEIVELRTREEMGLDLNKHTNSMSHVERHKITHGTIRLGILAVAAVAVWALA